MMPLYSFHECIVQSCRPRCVAAPSRIRAGAKPLLPGKSLSTAVHLATNTLSMTFHGFLPVHPSTLPEGERTSSPVRVNLCQPSDRLVATPADTIHHILLRCRRFDTARATLCSALDPASSCTYTGTGEQWMRCERTRGAEESTRCMRFQ